MHISDTEFHGRTVVAACYTEGSTLDAEHVPPTLLIEFLDGSELRVHGRSFKAELDGEVIEPGGFSDE